MKEYGAGIDIGSTTIKVVIMDTSGTCVFGAYRRHCAHIQETLVELLQEVKQQLGCCNLHLKVTGSGSMSLGKYLNIPFIQEVEAVATALQQKAPQTDVAIELGGEDAKIIYFDEGGIEERMNGVCAGGTGSFIDQMAALLQTDASGLNEEAKQYQQLYAIAARCGVFAKSDIQPLINEGASRADLAASIFQAVVNQTISGLACGKPIRGHVAFLGGPLHFLTELKQAFVRTLGLTKETTIDPEDSHLFAALGAAMESMEVPVRPLEELLGRLEDGIQMEFEIKRLEPLFESKAQYQAFCKRHETAVVSRGNLATYTGPCFLGVDAGSTTTKMALIGKDGELLFTSYANNQGNPIETAKEAITQLQRELPEGAQIVRSCATGYGEALLKSAFHLDEGEVETIAHATATKYFDANVDCVLDIGGQDMKCIKLRNGAVDTILLNEACSAGCGSFLENFAVSMGYTASEFASLALYGKHPVDFGTRCTVFMNSNVKQAQKEGADVEDISAGLAYSVIKNALYKVIKLADAKELGTHVVVQGGTFLNKAVLRAFEKVAGVEVLCPDIAGNMGAFGAALLARERYHGQESSMLTLEEIRMQTYATSTTRCNGCSNACMLTIHRFATGNRHVMGNRCERGVGGMSKSHAENMVDFKWKRIFAYPPLENPPRGQIGIPRVLNMYENYPFWATFFTLLGFQVVLSPISSRQIYELGMESIPSESECYPAKLAHGHVEWLISEGLKTIFHPCVFYERQEAKGAQNHYNCPMVVSYPENLKNNVESVAEGKVRYVHPFLAFTDEEVLTKRLIQICEEEWQIPKQEVRQAAHAAWMEQEQVRLEIREEGERLLEQMRERSGRGIVLAGRPYHIDPEIHHGIPEMIASYGLTVFTEDSLPVDFQPERTLRVNDQWVYHSRLYTAAQFVSKCDDLELIQLNSFGCGLDAVTTDQVSEILEQQNKLYTVLKIDEVSNLGAARIRLRSLLAAMEERSSQGIVAQPCEVAYERAEFTKQMFDDKYTILAPQMSPIHFDILEPVFQAHGFRVEILGNDDRNAIDVGLKFVNNDACFPSITTVGQIMEAVLSGRYDTDRLAIIMSQTGGCCRASNYVGFIRRALDKAGLSHIPVISLNMNGMEKNSGFQIPFKLLQATMKGLIYGDLFLRCLYRVRPYETVQGSADALHKKWQQICIESLTQPNSKWSYRKVCEGIVSAFDRLPIHESMRKPRVGIVGEILVKYMPLANNHLVELLEEEGAEAVVPDLIDFLNYCLHNESFKHKVLGQKGTSHLIGKLGIRFIRSIRNPAIEALQKSKRFDAPMPIEQVADYAKPYLSIGNQYGEGWFLTGEMIELIHSGVPNIVCIQPFGCLPNHVVGKGVIKAIKKEHKKANIVAVDYDPGTSEVNQWNRIRLMLSTAKKACLNE